MMLGAEPYVTQVLSEELELLTPDSRSRLRDFDCGDPEINEFIHERAWQQQQKFLNRTYLVRHDPPDLCPGFVALSAAHIESRLTGLPRNQLVYKDAPAALIARLGVDQRFKRKGVATDLIAAARVIALTLPVGCKFLVLHVATTNKPALSLYDKEGFRVPEGYEPEDGLLLMFYNLSTPRPAGRAGLSFAG